MTKKIPALAKGTTYGDYRQAILASSADALAQKEAEDRYAWERYQALFARNHEAMQRLQDEAARQAMMRRRP